MRASTSSRVLPHAAPQECAIHGRGLTHITGVRRRMGKIGGIDGPGGGEGEFIACKYGSQNRRGAWEPRGTYVFFRVGRSGVIY